MTEQQTETQPTTYTVQADDTFFKIALKFDISILNLKKQNPGISTLKPGLVLNVTQKHEKLRVFPIDSQIFDRIPPIDGVLILQDSQILFQPRPTKHNKKPKDITIDLLGFIDSNLTPHPCEFFDEVDEILPDDCLALLHVSYLSIPDDPTSIELIQFAGMLQELRNFKIAMELKAARFQNRNNYVRPLLSTFIKPAKEPKRRISTFTLETLEGTDPSSIVTPEQIQCIRDSLPSRLRHCKWSLLYDLSKDGSSFTSFSTKVKGKEHCILLLKTQDGDIFGAFSAAGFSPDKSYYANGETYVFTFFPSFAAYKWSKTTTYFVTVSPEELSVGGAGGAAIWIDDKFLNGFSEKCNAFNSPPLASDADFTLVRLEVWYIR